MEEADHLRRLKAVMEAVEEVPNPGLAVAKAVLAEELHSSLEREAQVVRTKAVKAVVEEQMKCRKLPSSCSVSLAAEVEVVQA